MPLNGAYRRASSFEMGALAVMLPRPDGDPRVPAEGIARACDLASERARRRAGRGKRGEAAVGRV
jgi:hypothetical protein